MMNMISSERKKQILEVLQRRYPDNVISESDIHIEQTLINSNNRYEFDILKAAGVDKITEIKLDKNDKFFVTQLGLFIAAQDQTAIGREILQTYPNEIEFPAVVGPPAFNPKDLERIYRGKLDIKIASTVFVESFKTEYFRNVPETQKSAAGNKSQKYPGTGLVEWNNLEFSGASDTEISVTIPLAGTVELAAQAANFQNILAFVSHGFLIKSAARL